MTTTINTPSNIDRLGQLLAQIAELTKEADAIKDGLKDEANLSGAKEFLGDLFRAAYIETNRSTVDWKGVAKAMNIPAELIAEHTKTAAVFSIKVTSK
jgi:hypothetical protein